MGKTIMGAVVSLDGFMADDNDGIGPLFDWYSNGDAAWSFEGSPGESRSTQASAFFATGSLPNPIMFDNPTHVVQGDRVTHLVYDVAKG